MTPPGPAQPRGPFSVVGILIGLALIVGAVIVTLVVVALIDEEESAPPNLGVTLQDIADDPQAFAGRRVIVSGQVGEGLTERAFVMGSQNLLVVDSAERTPDEGTIAQIDGTVQVMPVADLAREFDLTFDEAAREQLGADPVTAVVANAIAFSPTGNRLSETAALESIDAGDGVLALTEFLARFDALEGESVSIAGEVGIAYSTYVSSLSGVAYNTEDVILVSRDATVGGFLNLISARVSGTAVRFDPVVIEAEYGIDLEDNVVEQFVGQPAIVVDSVHFFPTEPRLGAAVLNVIGQPVTARGTISTVYSEHLFALEDDEVLVMSGRPISQLVPDALAMVTGTAGAFDTDELTPEHRDLLRPLTMDQIEDFRGHAVIMLEDLSLVR